MRTNLLLVALLTAPALAAPSALAQTPDTLTAGHGCVGAACAPPAPRAAAPRWPAAPPPLPLLCPYGACAPSPSYRDLGLTRHEARSINKGALIGAAVGVGAAVLVMPPSTPDGAFGFGVLGAWTMGGLLGAGVGAIAGYVSAQ